MNEVTKNSMDVEDKTERRSTPNSRISCTAPMTGAPVATMYASHRTSVVIDMTQPTTKVDRTYPMVRTYADAGEALKSSVLPE